MAPKVDSTQDLGVIPSSEFDIENADDVPSIKPPPSIKQVKLQPSGGDGFFVPTKTLSGVGVLGETHQILEKSCLDDLAGVFSTWDAQEEPIVLEPVMAFSTDAVPSAANQGLEGLKKDRNPSILSNESVDMDDNEILEIWKNTDSQDSASSAFTTGEPERRGDSYKKQSSCLRDGSLFESRGYIETMQDMQRMKQVLELEARIANLQRMRRPRRLSLTASSA